MKRFMSVLICILLITGGSAEAANKWKAVAEPIVSPAAVMFSYSAADPLLNPSVVQTIFKHDGSKEKEDKTKDGGRKQLDDPIADVDKASLFSADDQDLLARLVQAEAEGEPFDGKVAVAATVLNRVKSNRYPDTIPGVIYQWANGYQYCPVRIGTINKPAGNNARQAVEAALGGQDPTDGAVSFYNPSSSTNTWIRIRPVHVRIGNHIFVGP